VLGSFGELAEGANGDVLLGGMNQPRAGRHGNLNKEVVNSESELRNKLSEGRGSGRAGCERHGSIRLGLDTWPRLSLVFVKAGEVKRVRIAMVDDTDVSWVRTATLNLTGKNSIEVVYVLFSQHLFLRT
jgi:hypothetical protein